MSAADINAPKLEPTRSSIRPRGTVDEIVSRSDENSADVTTGASPELEGGTTPYGRLPVLTPDGGVVATVAAIEAPAPLLEDPLHEVGTSSSIASAVLRLTQIGKYELVSPIGHGTFGMVFTARDTELDREVALKILNPSHHGDADALHRFLREARAAARVAHPGIVTVHDCGRYVPEDGDELAYIAMERLCGESLTDRLARDGRMEPEAAAEIARQVASALEAAHRADVLHRDLKPDNVFLVPDPAVHSGERAKVFDFGLAKIGTSRHTKMGSVFGTPLYMSPEQCRSAGDTDARSDIYALGCILFELLTGRAPFEGAIFLVIERHLHEEAPRASSLVPGLPPALDALVAAMLEKNPIDRPQTMAEVERRIERAMSPRFARGTSGLDAALAPGGGEPPLVLSEADRRALDALVERPGPAVSADVARGVGAGVRDARRSRYGGAIAFVAALAIGLGLAGALSLMAESRHGGSGSGSAGGGGGGGGAADERPAPAAPSTSR